MKASEKLLHFLKSWEGCKLSPYMDSASKLTIGVGHLLLPGETLEPITEARALQLLANDLRTAENIVTDLVDVALEQHQADALISLTFNAGSAPLSGHVGQYINEHKFDQAADFMLNWDHVNGSIVSEGLLRRRQAERNLFLNGVYDENT